MRYVVNFQIKVTDDKTYNEIIRSSYTILEKDSEKYKLSNIKKVENWFKDFFEVTPLDHFIDTANISKAKNLDMKIGRITDSISGEYTKY